MNGAANVNGTSIFYETRGQGFPIVFVSGGGILDRVLIMRGDCDSPSYASMTDRIDKGIPQATTVVIEGGTIFSISKTRGV